jgi:hypothetical protein
MVNWAYNHMQAGHESYLVGLLAWLLLKFITKIQEK